MSSSLSKAQVFVLHHYLRDTVRPHNHAIDRYIYYSFGFEPENPSGHFGFHGIVGLSFHAVAAHAGDRPTATHLTISDGFDDFGVDFDRRFRRRPLDPPLWKTQAVFNLKLKLTNLESKI